MVKINHNFGQNRSVNGESHCSIKQPAGIQVTPPKLKSIMERIEDKLEAFKEWWRSHNRNYENKLTNIGLPFKNPWYTRVITALENAKMHISQLLVSHKPQQKNYLNSLERIG